MKHNHTLSQTLSFIAKRMEHNDLMIEHTYQMLTTLQHVYMVKAIWADSLSRNEKLKQINVQEKAITTVLEKIIANCHTELEQGFLRGKIGTPIKVHKFTRGKIWLFCNSYKDIEKRIPVKQRAKYILRARQSLDISLLAKNSVICQFLYA